MMKVFGFNHPDLPRVPVPVGHACMHCGELVAEGDVGFITLFVPAEGKAMHVPYHRECMLRGILGSVAHQQRRCSCFGGTGSDDDEPGVSPREAARRAVALYLSSHHDDD